MPVPDEERAKFPRLPFTPTVPGTNTTAGIYPTQPTGFLQRGMRQTAGAATAPLEPLAAHTPVSADTEFARTLRESVTPTAEVKPAPVPYFTTQTPTGGTLMVSNPEWRAQNPDPLRGWTNTPNDRPVTLADLRGTTAQPQAPVSGAVASSPQAVTGTQYLFNAETLPQDAVSMIGGEEHVSGQHVPEWFRNTPNWQGPQYEYSTKEIQSIGNALRRGYKYVDEGGPGGALRYKSVYGGYYASPEEARMGMSFAGRTATADAAKTEAQTREIMGETPAARAGIRRIGQQIQTEQAQAEYLKEQAKAQRAQAFANQVKASLGVRGQLKPVMEETPIDPANPLLGTTKTVTGFATEGGTNPVFVPLSELTAYRQALANAPDEATRAEITRQFNEFYPLQ